MSAAEPAVAWAFHYDPLGRLIERTDPNGHKTSFGFAMDTTQTPAPMVQTQTFPLLEGATKPYVQSQVLDSMQRLTALSDIAPEGESAGVTSIAYAAVADAATGAMNLQVIKTLPPTGRPNEGVGTLNAKVVYDPLGRILSRTDLAGESWTLAYTLSQTTDPATVRTVATETDPVGNQSVLVTDPSDRLVERRIGNPGDGATAPAAWRTTSVLYNAAAPADPGDGNRRRRDEFAGDQVRLRLR